MTPLLACDKALAMRRRHLRRQRLQRAAVAGYRVLAGLGVAFIVSLIAGWIR